MQEIEKTVKDILTKESERLIKEIEIALIEDMKSSMGIKSAGILVGDAREMAIKIFGDHKQYITGERGPELFTPSSAGIIAKNNK